MTAMYENENERNTNGVNTENAENGTNTEKSSTKKRPSRAKNVKSNETTKKEFMKKVPELDPHTVMSDETRKLIIETLMKNARETWDGKEVMVPIALLEVDYDYQKPINEKNLLNIARWWNRKKVGKIIVSLRKGHLYIIDGQHRVKAGAWAGEKEIPCIILEDMTKEQEAMYFATQNDYKTILTPYATYKAHICCGDISIPRVATDMKIKEICDRYGVKVVKVGRNSKNETSERRLRCLSLARNMVTSGSTECFEWVLHVIEASNWGSEPLSYSKLYMEMLRKVYNDNKNNLNMIEPYLVQVLNKYTPMQIEAKATKDHSEYGRNTRMSICIKELLDKEIMMS